MKNRYYIVKSDDKNLEDMVKLSTNNNVDELRYCLCGCSCILKLKTNDTKPYYFFKEYEYYTEEKIREILQNSDWIEENF